MDDKAILLRDKLNQIIVLTEESESLLGEGGPSLIKFVLKPIFDFDPSIIAVKWNQFTPYFNDGDPCVFSVNWEGSLKIEGVDEDAGDYEDGFISPWFFSYYLKKDETVPELGLDTEYWTQEKVDELLEITKEIGFDLCKSPYNPKFNGKYQIVLERIYGDGVEVVHYRDGTVEVNEYEHD